MNRACPQAARIAPGDRCVQRPITLEDARAVSKPVELIQIAPRKSVAGDGHQLAWSHIEEIGASRRQIGHRPNAAAGDHAAAQALELAGQRVGDFLRASARHRPAEGVRTDGKHQSIAAGGEVLQRLDRVCRKSGKQRTRRGLFEDGLAKSDGGAYG